jgi:hypothetical protein
VKARPTPCGDRDPGGPARRRALFLARACTRPIFRPTQRSGGVGFSRISQGIEFTVAQRHLDGWFAFQLTQGAHMKKSIATLAFVLASAAAWAVPTTREVDLAVEQGRYAEAETMMSEVVAAKPDSAKAHYVYAEVLAHNRNFSRASQEAARARQLDPAIKFTSADKFAAFEQLLQREQAQQARPRPAPVPLQPALAPAVSSSSGIPGWVWVAGLAAIGFVLWRGFNRSRAGAPGAAAGALSGSASAAQPSGSGGNPGVAPYGPATMPPASRGSGLLGTGLAVAGGVAGGMLIDEMLHHRQAGGSTALDRLGPGTSAPFAGDDAANELGSRPVDFGSGGDWDSGGSSDAGGGSDGGGGWD